MEHWFLAGSLVFNTDDETESAFGRGVHSIEFHESGVQVEEVYFQGFGVECGHVAEVFGVQEFYEFPVVVLFLVGLVCEGDCLGAGIFAGLELLLEIDFY